MTKNQTIVKLLGSALFVGTILASNFAIAQDKTAAVPTSVPVEQVKDQRALDLLKAMSDTLAKAQTMSFRVRSLVPFATPSGQQISLFGSSRLAMQRPDRLFVEIRGDLFQHNLYFNGKTVTAIGVEKHFYAQHEAAASTVDALFQQEHPGSDALAPFVDLLVSDPFSRLTKDLTNAVLVGQSMIDAVNTDHLAFSGNGVDWEIWIGAKDKLPRLMVVHYLSGERQPTFTVTFSDWKLAMPISAKTFNAAIPKDAVKVEFKSNGVSQSR